jgi:hypothetical protein
VLLLLAVLLASEWEHLRAFFGNLTRFRPGMSTDDAVWVVATVAILGAVVVLALRLIASGQGAHEHGRRTDDDEPRERVVEPPRRQVVVRPAHTRHLGGSEPEDREEEHDRVYRRGGRHRGSAFRG